MGKTGRKGHRRGFTLVETLTVAAILGILAAIAVPSVAAVQRRLRMAELDDYARQIFLAAQNEVTTMKASGELSHFAALFGEDDALDRAPADYPRADAPAGGEMEGTADTRWMGLYHLSSADGRAQTYLTRAIAAMEDATRAGGCFVLELDPTSGDIYSVFYAEEAFTYEQALEICKDSRERSARREGEPLLGYYGGNVGRSPAVGTPKTFSPQITVHNGEELWAEVTCGGLMPLRATQTDLTLTVTVTDEGGGAWSREFKGGRPAGVGGFFVNGDSVTVTVLLDSLDPEKPFAKLTEGKLNPGDDLRITAQMVYAPKSVEDRIDSGEGAVAEGVSSLFGAKAAGAAGTEVRVSAVRHLNNLRASLCEDTLSGGTEIVQTGDIDFTFDRWTEGEDHLTLEKNPLAADGFRPVENARLFTGGTAFRGEGMTISNFKIKGGGYTGLIAQAEDCAFEGVRLVNPSVSGTGNTGALAGYLMDSTVTDCRVYLENRPGATVDKLARTCAVTGGGSVGGLVGLAAGSGSQIKDSFAAIQVRGNNQVGGLAGYAEGAVENCYVSGDVSAQARSAGGLLGAGKSASVSDCYASGDVAAADSSGGLVGLAVGGSFKNCRSYGLVSVQDGGELGGFVGASERTSFEGCAYLMQVKYNAGLVAPGGVTPTGYEALRAAPANGGGISHPYSPDLWEQIFPFRMLRAGGDPMPHYGDWPPEYQLKTALVYYERYTSADADGSHYGYYAEVSLTAGGVSDEGWIVDTLRREPCVEDGYAVLSTYALTEFAYTLDVGIGSGPSARKTLTVADAWSAVDAERRAQALRLTDGVGLTFTKGSGSVVISNAKVYQLPFELQVTDRFNAKTFWETLTLYNGMAGARQVFSSYTFYYCPDFARNAKNPAEEGAVPGRPREPDTLYVRSARQLNGLGRSIYYWNDGGGAGKLTFVQEKDIDFSIYTDTYCGKAFDLMNTEKANEYRNKPIGRPNPSKGGDNRPGNFRNIYDGQGHRIIDYRCETYSDEQYRFTGLFGEVQGGILQNIVLVASDPEAGSGYIRSASDRNSDNDAVDPGVGALAGLLFVPKESTEEVATVRNCAVSGYIVCYDRDSGTKQPVVGGLVGFNFGQIENSSAVCKEVYVNAKNADGARIGGLVGSLNGTGTISNCYAGMTVLSGNVNKPDHLQIAGLLGGYLSTAGAADGTRRVENCYAFCPWTERGRVYPVCKDLSQFSIKNSFYLKDLLDGATAIPVNGVSGLDYPALSALALDGENQIRAEHSYPWSEDLLGQCYPFPAAVTAPEGGAYVHYGDWPETAFSAAPKLVYYESYTDGSFGYAAPTLAGLPELDRRDEKTIRSTGYGFLCGPDKAFTLRIDGEWQPTAGETLVESAAKTEETVAGTVYALYPLTQACETRLEAELWRNGIPVGLQYKDKTGSAVSEELHVNTLYGAAVFLDASGGTGAEAPFQVRTAEQLQNVAPGDQARYFLQTHGIEAAETTGELSLNKSGAAVYDGGGYLIRGLQKPLFGIIDGSATLKHVGLTGVKINRTGEAAALVLDNHGGTITDCFAQGEVMSANGTAAGLVHTNQGTIQSSYANCAVKGAGAAGFVWMLRGNIDNCYAGSGSGTIDATGNDGVAAGFAGVKDWGAVSNCYTVAALDRGTRYGFGNGSGWTKCFWAADAGHKGAVIGNQDGTKSTLREIAALNLGTGWTNEADAQQSHPDSPALQGAAYPYPKLAVLDHWGDWPALSEGVGLLGVGKVVSSSGYLSHQVQGCVADRSDPKKDGTEIGGKIYKRAPETYVALFGPGLDQADWEVTYQKGQKWYEVESIEKYWADGPEGFRIFGITTRTGQGSLKGLRLTNRNNTAEVYEFALEDGSFTYHH